LSSSPHHGRRSRRLQKFFIIQLAVKCQVCARRALRFEPTELQLTNSKHNAICHGLQVMAEPQIFGQTDWQNEWLTECCQ